MSAVPSALGRMLDGPAPLVAVEVEGARGSTPREEGAWMLVSQDAAAGTVGGGQLEYLGIDRARQMLRRGEAETAMDVPLGPEIGQCCGGFVRLCLRRVDAALAGQLRERLARADERRPHVYIFGAGHVGLALGAALALMPLRPILLDSRREALADVADGVETRLLALPEAALAEAPPSSAVAVVTHDHALDFLLTAEALNAGRFAYVGMIGSRTKKASFRRWYLSEGGTSARFERLVCPIGGSAVKDKRPEIIAALAAAEIVTAVLAPNLQDVRHREASAASPDGQAAHDGHGHRLPKPS